MLCFTVYSNSLCIICCLHSKSTIISEIMVTPINFQICDHWTALISIELTTNSGLQFNKESKAQSTKVQDVQDLMQRLIDAWAGVEEYVRVRMFIQDVKDHRRRRLHTLFSHRRILWIFAVTKSSMIVKIKLKFIAKWDISFILLPVSWHLLSTR